MIDWTSKKGQAALLFIKEEMDKNKSYREIALMINEQKMLKEIVTSEQVRGAKRYYIDKDTRNGKRVQVKKSTVPKSLVLSNVTRDVVSMFQERLPIIKDTTLTLDRSKPGVTSKTEEAVLMLSGFNVDERTLNSKINKITKEVKRIHYKQTAASRIDTLNIFMMGDMVMGMSEYANEEFVDGISSKRIDQMYNAVNKISEMLINLLINFKRITITAVSNTINNNGLNWDILFYKALEKIFVNYKGRITFKISDDNWLVKGVYKSKFLLVHESQITEDEYFSCKSFGIINEFRRCNSKVDYICTANHHETIFDHEVKEHIKNGSLASSTFSSFYDDYQYFFGVDVDGVSWRYKI